MERFIAGLTSVATSGYALVAYVVLVIAWGAVAVRTARLKNISKALALVPEGERKALLEKDYGFHLKEGMSARDFLKAQRTTYIFYGCIALIIAVLLLSAIALLRPAAVEIDPRGQAIRAAIVSLIKSIDNDFADIRGARSTESVDQGEEVYESSVSIPGTTYNYIEFDRDGPPAFVSSLYFGTDERVAYRSYQDFIAELRLVATDWIEHSAAMDKERPVNDYVTFVKGQRKIIVAFNRGDEPGEWHVTTMFKKPSPDDPSPGSAELRQPSAPSSGEPPSGRPPQERVSGNERVTSAELTGEVSTKRPEPAPPQPIVVTPSGQQAGCEMARPDRAPNVALQAGEVVFAAEGGLLRLDREMKPQRILVLDELANSRGIAVESNGMILVSTRVCNSGAIVRVDPRTGVASLVATGFKTTKSILIEPAGTLLVSDEVGSSPWGYLWRLNLQTGEQQEIHRFSGDEVATGLGVNARTGDVFFTRRGLYRLGRDGVSRMAVEGVLQATNMTMFRDNLLVSGDGPPAIEMKTSGELIGTMESGGPVTSLAARGSEVFIGYGNGRVGRIRAGTTNAENVWEGKSSGGGVFVAVVPPLQP